MTAKPSSRPQKSAVLQLDHGRDSVAIPVDVTSSDEAHPFRFAHRLYREAGWQGTVPLPHLAKKNPPKGFTGHGGQWPTDQQLAKWAAEAHGDNIGLRLPPGVIGIDVDQYLKEGRQKRGAEQLAALIVKHGPLPATWSSTRREADGPSRIHLFRVPAGTELETKIGADIEAIQFHHRYLVAWPSVVPDDANPDDLLQYAWYDEEGNAADRPPRPEELAELPEAWIKGLSAQSRPHKSKLAEKLALPSNDPGRGNDWLTSIAGSLAKQVGDFKTYLEMVRAADRGSDDPQDPAVVDEIAMRLWNKEHANLLHKEEHRGQLRMAERFARQHEETLRYAHGLGWLVWDGTRWAKDHDGAAMRAVVQVIKTALMDVATIEDDDERGRLFSDVRKSESANALEGILKIAASLSPIAVPVTLLDADPFLFNVANGTLDLRTGNLRPHDRGDLITKAAGCGYDPHAEGPAFNKFLAEALPDQEIRDFVQRVFGYSMLGLVRDHVMPIFTGTGRNGKGTLIGQVQKAFGDYAIEIDPDILIDQGNHHAHPTGQADLFGVRLAIASETDESNVLAAATIKRLTGGDKVRARKMRQDYFEFDPSHTFVMLTNYKPRVTRNDPALWARLHIVPFDVVFDRPDTKLPEKLAKELSATLRWLVDGYRAYADQGLNVPAKVAACTAGYRKNSDAMGRYLEDRTREGNDQQVSARALFADWDNWRERNKERAFSEVEFAEEMSRRGHEKKRTKKGVVYVGVGLRGPAV